MGHGLPFLIIGCKSGIGLGMREINLNGRTRGPRGPRAPAFIPRLLAILLAALPPAGALAQTGKEAPQPAAGTSADKGLRYVSLKADRVYLRRGPGTEYPVAWVYQRAGLPVEVIREFEVWRQVRDATGTVGWVHSSLLSGRRTALVLPWEVKENQPDAPLATLRDDDHARARAVAQVEAGVLASIIRCDKGWCRVSIGDHRGYIEQTKLWGTYPNETIR
jgi:SH3-like domain-containing protein